MGRRPSFLEPAAVLRGLGALVLLGVLGALYAEDVLALIGPFDPAQALPGQGPVFGPAFTDALLSFAFAFIAPLVLWNGAFWLVSQFVLPVNTPEERQQVSEHFSRYAFGQPAPAIFIKNGELVASRSEKETGAQSDAVLLVDSVSAVVLRTDTRYTRAHGPGVVFTHDGEYIAEALDLRQQERHAERTKAYTRDGIALTLDVRVTFTLDSGERNPLRTWQSPNAAPFGFNPESAYRAVYGRAFRDRLNAEWEELPARLAADILRELLIQRDFESLFRTDDASFALLGDLQYQIEDRMMGWTVGQQSREQQVLAERGIRVLAVRLLNLELPPEVERKRLVQLKEDWNLHAKQAASDLHPSIRGARDEGRQVGQAHILHTLTTPLRRKLAAGEEPSAVEAACDLTEAARQMINDLGWSEQMLSDVRKSLVDMEIAVKKVADEVAFKRP